MYVVPVVVVNPVVGVTFVITFTATAVALPIRTLFAVSTLYVPPLIVKV